MFVNMKVSLLLPRATPASTMYALDDFAFFQLGLGNAANAVGGEVGISCLDAAQTAQVLVALLLPLGDQVAVGDLLLEAIVVQF